LFKFRFKAFLPPWGGAGRQERGQGGMKNEYQTNLNQMKRFIPYNPKLKPLARKLCQEMTFGEVLLWNELKEDKLLGFDFNRQCCLDEYIVDFYCKELMLAIEIDGQAHNGDEAFAKDEIRQKRLESLGVYFVRFSEGEVRYDRLNTLRVIEAAIIELIKYDNDIKLPKGFDLSLLNNLA
jgi:very-short-patch-repair endonuclease